ncbi:MAG: peptidylprolyl isomerase [Paludibacteraceae bacterium]
MKKIISSFFLLFLVSALVAQQKEPTLMTINGKKVPLSEFEYIYNKNNSNNILDKKSLTEYVDLFVNFKLKVEEALTQQLDTLPSFISELATYQKQLAEPYLQDTVALNQLADEAYYRTKNEVEVSHILIKISNIGTETDTLTAYNKAMDIWKRSGKEDFAKLAEETSEDPSVGQNKGYVGWITALRTPYTFENIAFNTPVGKVSKPTRTYLGYHLIKVLNKRSSRGEVLTAHIMKFTRPDSIKEKAKTAIDSLYQRILAGDDFGELAKKYSDDKGSARNGGELMWFGNEQRMVPEFEDAAFALKNKEDISKPVLSPYGWHIIKLLDRKSLEDFSAMKSKLSAKIAGDERSQKAKEAFVNGVKKQYGFRLNNEAVSDFKNLTKRYAPTDSLFEVEVNKLEKTLFTIGDIKYSEKDFGNYILSNVSTSSSIQADYIKNKLNTFVDAKLIEYEQARLGGKYPEYYYLMKEYHDGILLFDISNREVWDKATKDTEGLTKFFEKHKADYVWDKPHYKGKIIFCKDKSTYDAANTIIKNAAHDSIDTYLNKRLNDSIKYVKIEKGLWIENDHKLIDKEVFKTGTYKTEEDYPYYIVIGKLLKKEPETYEDVRGAVTTDYQNYLEKEWIKSLRKKYSVEIDQKVLKTVKKN